MEILVGPWAIDADLAPWPVFPSATPSVGVLRYDFAANWPAVQFSPGCSWASTSWNVWSGTAMWDTAGVAEQAAVSALTAVGAALEAALLALATFLLNAVETLMTATFKVVWGAISTASNDLMQLQANVAADIVSYMTGGGSLGAASGSDAIAIAPFLIFSAAITVLIDIVLGITTPVSIGVSLLLGLLITVIISVVGKGSVNQQGGGSLGSFLSIIQTALAATTKTFVAATEDAMNFTFQKILGYSSFSTADVQLIGDPPDYMGAFLGGVFAGLGIFGATLKLLKLGQSSADPLAQFGFTLSLFALALSLHTFLFDLSQPNGCNQLPSTLVNGLVVEDSAAGGFGGIGLLADIVGLRSLDPDNKEVAEFGLGLAGLGIIGSAITIHTDAGCETTAT